MDLALNNLQRLICLKTQQTNPVEESDQYRSFTMYSFKEFCIDIGRRQFAYIRSELL